jgi:hypothetical protein
MNKEFVFGKLDNPTKELEKKFRFKFFTNLHTEMYNTSYEMFLDKKFLGHGPKMYRIICKEYDIKTEKGRSWRFVYHNNTKVGVESLPKRTRIRHFDDVEANYIFNWRTQYPCTAISYLINRSC